MKKKLLSSFIAVLMVFSLFAQPLVGSSYVFAAEEVTAEAETVKSILIKENFTTEQVNEALSNALLGEDAETQEWEYYCEGSYLLSKNSAWGSVAGFSSQTGKLIKITYSHDPLAKNSDGNYKVRVKGSTEEYSIEKVSKLASSVALKSGVAFTYNKDVNLMKQEVFNKVIDWKNSVLPSKDELSIDDFTFEYESELSLFEGNLNSMVSAALDKILKDDSVLKAYAPFEGKKYELLNYTVGEYPQIGAGTHNIRVSYNGNDLYKSSKADSEITINKAKVKVKVKSTTAYVSESAKGLDLVTTDPEDNFDTTVIYAGITSNVTLNLYVQLPEKYALNGTLVKLIDEALKALNQPTLTEILQNGISLGELKEMLKASEVIETLEKLGVDTGVFGQLITVIDKLPSITDGIRIAIGCPNTAGAYTVTAITSNKNYETGIGVGALLVRAEKAKLVWNQTIAKKITVAEAATIDFGASIQVNGETVKDQSSLKVLYTGLTSKFKPYANSKAPTEAGSYVMTVSTIGGNYLTTPISRSFQIKK